MMLNSVGLKAGLLEEEVLQVFSVLQEMIDRTEMDSQSKEVNFNAQTCRTRNTAEMKWTEQAQVCCFYYHPELGNKNLTFPSLVLICTPERLRTGAPNSP